MLQPIVTANALETSIRALVFTDGGHSPYLGSDCRIDLAYEAATITVEFAERNTPDLTIGQWVVLQFDLGDDVGALESRAKAMSWRRGAGVHTYTFQADRSESKGLAQLVSRRAEERVRVDLVHPVRAAITDGGFARREGSLHDLSLGGCALEFDEEEPWMVTDERELRVCFDLFPGDGEIELGAKLRSRRLSGLRVLYGFMFDANDPELIAMKPRLQRFLDQRAQEVDLLD